MGRFYPNSSGMSTFMQRRSVAKLAVIKCAGEPYVFMAGVSPGAALAVIGPWTVKDLLLNATAL